MPLTWAFVVLFWNAVASAEDAHADQGWELRVTSSDGPQDRTCFDAPGLPKYTRGSFFIAGPAKFEGSPGGEWRYQAIFDGLGMVNRFELHPSDKPGEICFMSAWMNTAIYRAYASDPTKPPRGVIFEDTVPPREKCLLGMCDYTAANDNNWVNMIVVGGEALWLSDTATMLTMDLDTLNVTGYKQWADDKPNSGRPDPDWILWEHFVGGGSAHPLLRPGTSEVVEVMAEQPFVIGSNYLDIYTFDASVKGMQSRKKLARIKEDAPQYLHSFGVTPNYVIIPLNIAISMGPGISPVLLGKFQKHWRGIHVVDLKGRVQKFDDMDSFAHVHVINSFENETGIVMDLGAYEEVPFVDSWGVMDIEKSLNKTLRDSKPLSLRSQIRRFHFNMVTGKTTAENLTEIGFDYDFVKINPAYNGLPYCIYYAVEWFHNGKEYSSMAILKHNVCLGKMTYWSQPNTYVTEPFFVASDPPGAEDEGTLAFVANDGNIGKGIFVVLDAQSFTEIQRVQLPKHFPFLAHGNFVPASSDYLVV